MTIRRAGPDDAGFLAQMLVAAAFWRDDGPAGSVDEVMRRPEFAHYISGWPTRGDLGVVEVDDGSGEPVGAAWLRFLGGADAGYGYVDEATPELTIGVAPGCRGRGIGGRLIDALLAAARDAGISAVSLSVDPDNYAMALYVRHGFRVVGGNGGSATMLSAL
ncbi:MAG: GCN5-related protein N-acetyltransferase [Pseudonocardiales bacterium]|nr:GCN5-related protein N-acetyltransferase [Pseudonocardiales bacterium]